MSSYESKSSREILSNNISLDTISYEISFRLIAENREGTLVIEVLKQNLYIVRPALEVLRDRSFLLGFSPIDAARIGVIAYAHWN